MPSGKVLVNQLEPVSINIVPAKAFKIGLEQRTIKRTIAKERYLGAFGHTLGNLTKQRTMGILWNMALWRCYHGGVCQRLDALQRWRAARPGRRDRREHAEAARARPNGAARADDLQVGGHGRGAGS